MRGMRPFIAAMVIGSFGVAAQKSEGALAQAAGGSGYSGTLSSNKAIRKQQLIADPAEPTNGSTSILYNPAVVTISDLTFGPSYFGQGFVEVNSGEGVFMQTFASFFDSPGGTETGYLQVFYNQGTEVPGFAAAAVTPAGQITPPPGYIPFVHAGTNGVDTHAVFFDYLETVPDSTIATYKIYADPGGRQSDNPSDFLEGVDEQGNPFRLGPNQLSSATVSGSLNSIPLPPAVLAGGATLGLMAVGRRVRRFMR